MISSVLGANKGGSASGLVCENESECEDIMSDGELKT